MTIVFEARDIYKPLCPSLVDQRAEYNKEKNKYDIKDLTLSM